jgi:protein-tyrosine phosphatase
MIDTMTLAKLNFRDIGGIAAEGGRLIRKGLVYRSEGPASFDELHGEELRALNIHTVCDLRSEVERNKDPHAWLTGDCSVLELDMNTDLRAGQNDGWALLAKDPKRETALQTMRMTYSEMPGALVSHLGAFFDTLIEEETPMLIHCTAGKDRTGVLVAILLRVLGVKHVDIMQDYLRSNVFAHNRPMGESLAHTFQEYFGFIPPAEVIETMMAVHPEFIESAFEVIDTKWDGLDGYLATAGVDSPAVTKLRDAMLLPVG